MLSIKSVIAKMLQRLNDEKDYVVATGTSGSGTYRKWNSGKCEFWFTASNSSGITTTKWNNVYYVDSSSWSSTWSGVFNAAPTQVIVSNNDSQFISVSAFSWTSNGVANMRFISAGALSNKAYKFSLYAVGTWK